jgi:hypothetical protein
MKYKIFEDNDDYLTLDPNMIVHPNPAPRKMAVAVAFVEKYGLPEDLKTAKKKTKKQSLPPSNLQKELLFVEGLQANDQKIATLKAFIQELFAEEIAEKQAMQTEKLELAA